MKKTICVFGCVMVTMLAGCQSQGELPDDKTPPVHSSNSGGKGSDSVDPSNTPANPGNDPAEIDAKRTV